MIEEKLKRVKRTVKVTDKIGELTVMSISDSGITATCKCSCGKKNVKRKVVSLKSTLKDSLSNAYCYDCKKANLTGKLY